MMTTKKTGNLSRVLGCVTLLACCLTAAAVPGPAGKKDKKPNAAVEPAILAGTVFSGAGFALRGAEISVKRADGGSSKERWRGVSDARGEFLIRLPAGPAKYNVSVRASGVKPQEKELTFEASERLDQNFLLEPATEGAR
jgi:hypothetical protein